MNFFYSWLSHKNNENKIKKIKKIKKNYCLVRYLVLF